MKFKLSSIILSTFILTFSAPLFAASSTHGKSAQAIFEALSVLENEVYPTPHEAFRTTEKEVGGLRCTHIHSNENEYECTLSDSHNAGAIYSSLHISEIPLAPGYCGPSSFTKNVGSLSCNRTTLEGLFGMSYDCYIS